MTIDIPAWLLWTLGLGLGIPAALFITMCAIIGFAFWRNL